ncbi:MAG: molybdopterin synthase catalytic subunit [Limisphaerales bacterium]|jgi:molybdopterin synthase catalytic subunit
MKNSGSHLILGPIDPVVSVVFLKNADEDNAGAIASFAGIIRADKIEEKAVAKIEYSAYEAMAEKILSQIEARILKTYQLSAIQILHSTGVVCAGEMSMWIGVRAKHRAAAFDALRDAVETIKAEAPVWKKEIFADQTSRWVAGNFE